MEDMLKDIFDILVDPTYMSSTFNTLAMILLISFIAARTRIFYRSVDTLYTRKSQFFLFLVYSVLTLYASHHTMIFTSGTGAGVTSIANVSVRHSGPILAGIIGGPWVGVFVGIVGGAERWFYGVGSWYREYATIAMVLMGVCSGVYNSKRKGKLNIRECLALAFGLEVIYIIGFLFSNNFAITIPIAKQGSVLLIFGNMCSVFLGVYISKYLLDARESQDKFKDSEQRLSGIFEFLPDPTFVVDKNKRVIKWNKAMEHLTNIKEPHILGKTTALVSKVLFNKPDLMLIDYVLDKKDLKDVKHLYNIVCEDGMVNAQSTESRDESRTHYIFKVRTICGEDGEIIGAVQTVRDITPKVESDLDVMKRKEEYKGVFNVTGEALIILDRVDSTIRDVNLRTLELFGASKDDMLGFKYDDYLDDSLKYLGMVVDQQEYCKRVVHRKKNGSTFIADVRLQYPSLEASEIVICSLNDLTYTLELEKRVREREELFRLFVENFPGFLFLKDSSKRTIMLSKFFESSLGKPISELLGKDNFDLWERELAITMTADDDIVLSYGPGEVLVVEEVAVMQEKLKNLTTYKFPIHTDKGVLIGGITVDETDRKAAENNLKISEEKFSKAFHMSPDGIAIIEYDSEMFVDINEGFTEILGYAKSDIVGSYFSDFARIFKHGEDAHRIYKEVEAGNEFSNQEIEAIKECGEEIIISLSSRNIIVDNVQCVLALFKDVTEKSRSQELVQKSEERLRNILDSIQIGIAIVEDDTRKITYVNNMAISMSGYTKDELIGVNCFDTICPAVEAICPVLDLNEEIYHSERCLKLKDKSLLPVDKTALPIMLEGKRYLIESFTDITQRLEMERDQAKAIADALLASRTKTEFLANMSHEIRTPMNSVMGMIELLLRTDLNDKQKKLATTSFNSSRLLLTIINDILDLSKIEAGKMSFVYESFDIRSMVQELLDIIDVESNQKGIPVSKFIAPSIPYQVVGDITRVKQIFLNLLSNAVKFTTIGQIDVRLDFDSGDSDSVVVKFTVKDTGIGIDADKFDMLFKPFSQIDGSITRKFGGTGLGLVISSKLADLMGGKIGFSSEKDSGSTFWFTLPFKIPKMYTKEIKARDIDSKPVFANTTTSSILLVEDNEENQNVISHQMEELGYTLDIVSSGAEAIKVIKEKDYALVFMDIQMPEMDGFQTTNKLREEIGFTNPIIALTARAMNGDRNKCISYGMNDYISKPTDLKTIKDKIEIWWGR